MISDISQVKAFLKEFIQFVKENDVFFVPRLDTSKHISTLGIDEQIGKEIIKQLTHKNYSRGPMDDDDDERKKTETGQVWIFGTEVSGKRAYIKLKLCTKKSNGRKVARCISFHKEEFSQTFPHAGV